MKKQLAWLLSAAMALSVTSGCAQEDLPAVTTATVPPLESEYTYRGYQQELPATLDPHNWVTDADAAVLEYLQTPLVSIAPTEEGHRWVFEAALSVTDVTRKNRSDLTRYAVTLPDNMTLEGISSGYVFEIRLRQGMVWENGDPINADSYLYSMQALLDPALENTRASLWYSGSTAIAGGEAYYLSGDKGLYTPYTQAGYSSVEQAVEAEGSVFLNMWDFWGMKGAADTDGAACPQWLSIHDAHPYTDPANGQPVTAAGLYEQYAEHFRADGADRKFIAVYRENPNYGAAFDSVGFYKTDDYTLRYVTQTPVELEQFLAACSTGFLVHPQTYENCKATGSYGAAAETVLSYGPYRLASRSDTRLELVQNGSWWGWEKDAEGKLVSFAPAGEGEERIPQYQTTRILISHIPDNASAEVAFFRGELDHWTPQAQSFADIAGSSRLYKEDTTYTLSLFFNTDIDALLRFNEAESEQNAQILTSSTFRTALSLAVDRSRFVTATMGYTPQYTLLSDQYLYELSAGQAGAYRQSEAAMEAMCRLYGITWGKEGEFTSLQEAYASITGYFPEKAKALMAQACSELQISRIYTPGDPIHLRIAWSSHALTEADLQQAKLLEEDINAAMEGSGFGKLTLEPVGNVENRYTAVPDGEFAIGLGAWGGAALYPFESFRKYCDSDVYDLHEAACWNPYSEALTLKVRNSAVTLTWRNWSNALSGTGRFLSLHKDFKLQLTAEMEEAFLAKAYRIPLCSIANYSILGSKLEYATDQYSPLYGFGGLRYASYNYDDAGWADYVAAQGGHLDYSKA